MWDSAFNPLLPAVWLKQIKKIWPHTDMQLEEGGLCRLTERVLGIPRILRPRSDNLLLGSGWCQSTYLRGNITSDLLLNNSWSRSLQMIYLKKKKRNQLIQLIPIIISLIYIGTRVLLGKAGVELGPSFSTWICLWAQHILPPPSEGPSEEGSQHSPSVEQDLVGLWIVSFGFLLNFTKRHILNEGEGKNRWESVKVNIKIRLIQVYFFGSIHSPY